MTTLPTQYISYKHSCVTDANGYYKTIVLVLNEPVGGDELKEHIQHYTMAEGDRLIDTTFPTVRPHAGTEGLIRPRWDGTAWTEGVTEEETTAWEAEHPAPEPSGPSAQEDADAMIVDHEYRLPLLELGVN